MKALREGWQLPESFQRREAERKEAEALEEERKRLEICSICQGRGVYYIDNNKVARCDHTGRKKRRSPPCASTILGSTDGEYR